MPAAGGSGVLLVVAGVLLLPVAAGLAGELDGRLLDGEAAIEEDIQLACEQQLAFVHEQQ